MKHKCRLGSFGIKGIESVGAFPALGGVETLPCDLKLCFEVVDVVMTEFLLPHSGYVPFLLNQILEFELVFKMLLPHKWGGVV